MTVGPPVAVYFNFIVQPVKVVDRLSPSLSPELMISFMLSDYTNSLTLLLGLLPLLGGTIYIVILVVS